MIKIILYANKNKVRVSKYNLTQEIFSFKKKKHTHTHETFIDSSLLITPGVLCEDTSSTWNFLPLGINGWV